MTQQNKIEYTEELTELIRKIPKTDLHVHLDGSLRLETLIEIAKKVDATFVLVGDGSKLNFYKQNAPSNVIFTGRRTDVENFYKIIHDT